MRTLLLAVRRTTADRIVVGLLVSIALLWSCNAEAADATVADGPLTADERAALLAELKPLETQMEALRGTANISPDRWADAYVFIKGVEWALEFGPVNDARSRGLVKFGIDRGRDRVKSLAAGHTPWLERRGRVVRGFVSEVDGSVQPYGVAVPESYDPAKPARLHVVLHGSTPATGIGELLFLEAADSGAKAAESAQYIELFPMGRLGENSYRFEGETDVDEAIEAACREYNIDRARIVLRGHSLGGVGTWQLGLKRPDRWVAIGPGAGPVDTQVFAMSPWEHFVRLEPLTPWQLTTLHLVDAIDYVANAGMVPVVASMGDKDAYYSSHLMMEHAFGREGLPFEQLVDRGAGHSITAAVVQAQIDRLDELAVRGADQAPRHVRFTTWTLKYNRCRWIEILGLEAHYGRAEIEASIDDDGLVAICEPQNVTRFCVHPPAISNHCEFVTIGGVRVAVPKLPEGIPRAVVFERQNGRWISGGPLGSVKLTGKRPGLQGPIDDAFAKRFLCVRGTGQAWNQRVDEWSDASLRRFADEWRRHYRGYLPIKNDFEVTDDDVRHSNLILFGDPGSNSMIGKVLPRLPIQWTREVITVGPKEYAAADHAVAMIQPNPLPGGDGHYVVINSGHTYHDAELRFSYMVFPRLGDWAVIRAGENSAAAPAGGAVAESVVESGFFDEAWAFPQKK